MLESELLALFNVSIMGQRQIDVQLMFETRAGSATGG